MLILACSRRKRPDEDLLPAVERYDGPAFRVLRRFLRDNSSKAPDTLILSAEHGLISHDSLIAGYDRKMTAARARELRPFVLAELERMIASRSSPEILVFAGKHYLPALDADDTPLLRHTTTKVCAGSLGRKLAELHDWLHGSPPKLRYNSTMLGEGHRVRIRGTEISLTSEEALDFAKEALGSEQGNPERYESWYVEVGERRVAPKWLVSQLTGIPVASFHSDDARRVLRQLGLKVRRV
jgi:hypothetical protein